MKAYYVCFLLLFCLIKSLEMHPKEEEVLVLNDQTIDEAINFYPNLVIKFYAPWCPHCIQLAPEYAKAAKHFHKNSTIPIKLGKIDITSNSKAAEKFSIQGLPSLKWFTNGTHENFLGGRSSDQIIKWIMMKLYSPMITLTQIEDIGKLERSSNVSLVYFGDNQDDLKKLNEFALSDSNHDFFVYSVKGNNKYKINQRTLVLFKPFDERIVTLKGPFSKETIETFISFHKYPTVIENMDMAVDYLTFNQDPIAFLIRDPSDTKYDQSFKNVGKRLKKDIQSAITPSNGEREKQIYNALKIDLQITPIVVIVQHGKRGFKTFNITSNISEETIEKFIKDYFAGGLPVDIVSEEIPTVQTGPVFQLVNKSFKKEVLDNDKDVLVKFYQPWCGFCKKLAPIYEELAQKLKDNKQLRIADFDMSVNDFDLYKIEGYPTLLFYKGNKKDSPMQYDGERTVKAFEEFLQKEAFHSIQIPKNDL